jgi:hypothetical protein
MRREGYGFGQSCFETLNVIEKYKNFKFLTFILKIFNNEIIKSQPLLDIN